MDIIHHYLYSLRHEYLTDYFKIYTLIINRYFFISILSFGYWTARDNKIYKELGFLLPFTICTVIFLKALFKLPRPDTIYHLMHTNDPFGFPSGDVLLATVFLGIFLLKTQSNFLKTFLAFIIVNVMLSRIYLGLHSIFDVFGGLFFGIIILWIWKTKIISHLFDTWLNNKHKNYFLFLLMFIIIIYHWLLPIDYRPKSIAEACGFIIALWLSLPFLCKYKNLNFTKFSALMMLVVIFALIKFIPVTKENEILAFLAYTIKYSFIMYTIYTFLPLVILNLKQRLVKFK